MTHRTVDNGYRPANNTRSHGFAFKSTAETANALTTNANTSMLSFKGECLKVLLSNTLEYKRPNFSKKYTNEIIH